MACAWPLELGGFIRRRSRVEEVILRKILIGSLLLCTTLAGCGNEQSEGPVKPGIYAYEAPDGSRHRMVFQDSTYADMADNVPKPVEEGTWQRRDGQLCMTSGATGSELCFDEKAEADGGFSLTANGMTTHFSLVASAR